MKKFRILSLILAFVLTVSSIPFMVYAEDAAPIAEKEYYTFEDGMGKVEIPYTTEDSTYSKYCYSEMKVYSTANAAAAGIPEGYTGDYVMALTKKTNVSITLDLRQTVCKDIKIEDVESISFKVWIPAQMDLRIKTLSPISVGEWAYNKAYTGNSWHTVTITDMATFVDDGNGYFSPFAFTFRDNSNKTVDYTVYFDAVTVKLKEVVEEPTETEVPTETEAPETTETEAPTETETETETETPVVPAPLYHSFEEGKGKEEIPYGDKSNDGTWYGYTNFKMMDEAQAKYAKVPDGYSGWVLAIDPEDVNTSIGLDLTAYRVATIKKITFRLWCPTGTKQDSVDGGIRLSGAATNSWAWKASPSAIGEWIEVTLEKDDYSFLDFDNDGYCNAVNLCLRGATATAYIDAITVELKPNDGVAPQINYNGETTINTSAGKPFVIDVSVYDAEDEEYITPEYIWSGDALDAEGKLLEGNYTLTVKATDFYGNVSEIVLTVNVGARDTEAPVLNWCPDIDGIYAMEGTIPSFNVTATDNYDKVDVVLTWSKDALNEAGRLNKGLHTLTVSATDLSGNSVEYSVYVCVISERPTVGNVILDSN